MRYFAVIVFVIAISSRLAAAGTVEAVIIETMLRHFAARTDATFPNKSGVLLVEPNSQVWTVQLLRTFGLLNRTTACLPESDLAERIALRNASAFVVASAVTPGDGWRFMGRGELAADDYFPPLKDSGGTPIKSVATVALPVFSTDKQRAFAFLTYSWSVHTAIAEYAFNRKGDSWEVTCSELHIYP
jgi:hypothetical protein